ncbi:hypothetical protein BJX65DRAFT_294688 [Aspergillus insuetus]
METCQQVKSRLNGREKLALTHLLLSCDSLPSTLPLPKHHLPARPPAKVCVLVSANTQLFTISSLPSSHLQTRELLNPNLELNTFSEEPNHGVASLRNLVPYIQAPALAPDPISHCDPQENDGISTKAPAFWGDYAEDGLLSPSILSLDNSLEESFQPPDAHGDVPINPLILINDGSWRDINRQLLVPQDNSLVNLEITCPYPDPPATLHSPLNHYRDASERNVEGDSGLSYPDSAHGNHHVDGGSKSSKRKAHQSEGQARKRHRIRSTLPPTSSLRLLITVCNSFLGYTKVLYGAAPLTLHRQHVKMERRA